MVIKKDSIQTKSPAWTALHDRLAGRGGRLTPQRMAIYEAVVGRTSHPSVAAVHQEVRRRFPGLSAATVYSALDLFARLGFIQEVSGAVRRYDGRAGTHVNLVCQRCGRITDVPDVELEAVQHRAASRARFLVAAVRFELHGFCPGCQRSTRRGRGRDARS
ncbi:MAG TPA: Fur family transcriptional regulator [bacterium]|nr:Fur family transcriptional regulator [bacterium]